MNRIKQLLPKTIPCILTAIVLICCLSCVSNRNVTKRISTEELSNIEVEFYTEALPDWSFNKYGSDGKRDFRGSAEKFVFMGDGSILMSNKPITTPFIADSLAITEKYVEVGTYSNINDSIIEIYYEDGAKIPKFYIDSDSDFADRIMVTIIGKGTYAITHRINYLSWELLHNGEIIMPLEWAFQYSEEEKVLGGLTTVVDKGNSFYYKVDSVFPDEVVFRTNDVAYTFPDRTFLANKSCKTESESSTLSITVNKYALNIKNVNKNYLDVTDLRRDTSSIVNRIIIDYPGISNRWFPSHLSFKKKYEELILLNKDGSESEYVINMFDSVPVYCE